MSLNKDREYILKHYLAALVCIKRGSDHLVEIENRINKFQYSKPVNTGHKRLDEICDDLERNLEKMTRKKLVDMNRRVRIREEFIRNPGN